MPRFSMLSAALGAIAVGLRHEIEGFGGVGVIPLHVMRFTEANRARSEPEKSRG